MVYRFKLVSDEVSNFSREIEIDSESSFLQLRNAILDSVGYSKDELDSFFLCDDDWQKEEEITLEDMGTVASDKDLWLMENTILNEMIEDEGQKLIFVFDYLTDRSFFMEMKEVIPGRNLPEPICTVKKGTPPEQVVDMEEFEKTIDAKMEKDLDMGLEEFYGDTHFDEDEMGEGFEDLNFS